MWEQKLPESLDFSVKQAAIVRSAEELLFRSKRVLIQVDGRRVDVEVEEGREQ